MSQARRRHAEWFVDPEHKSQGGSQMKPRLGVLIVGAVLATCGLIGHASVQSRSGAQTGVDEPIPVEGGLVTGTQTPQWTYGVRLFRGIPFAAPPVGELRWRAPQPVQPWTGIKRAEEFSPGCIQPPTDTEGNAWREGLARTSEDCLYLNVWTPARSRQDRLPVMVFIHGGGNTRGAASENQYDGAYLAKKGVVFVSLNYRMNVFGFLAHPDLTRESEHRSSGNYALLDQLAALRWVQKNISAFGGDPGTVMVFGHSAGASNLMALHASPLGKGLFQRVLIMSGSSLTARAALSEAEKSGLQFAATLGASSVADLRKKSAVEILQAQRPQMGLNVDGWVLPRDVYGIFASGQQADVPLMVGSVADDAPGAPSTTTAAAAQASARTTFGDMAERYLSLYPAATDAEARASAHAYRTNTAMANARAVARLQTQTGKSKAFWYYFAHTSPAPEGLMWGGRTAASWGAYHGGELVYFFNAFPLQDWPWRPTDLRLGDVVSSMIVNFAKTGSPNGPGLPEWPAFDPRAEVAMTFASEARGQAPPHRSALAFIDEWAERQRPKR